ncbi:Neurogenic locus notch like protein 2, partial [Dissostichus eleginoides]
GNFHCLKPVILSQNLGSHPENQAILSLSPERWSLGIQRRTLGRRLLSLGTGCLWSLALIRPPLERAVSRSGCFPRRAYDLSLVPDSEVMLERSGRAPHSALPLSISSASQAAQVETQCNFPAPHSAEASSALRRQERGAHLDEGGATVPHHPQANTNPEVPADWQYTLSIVTSAGFEFQEMEMPLIRKWWCLLMERFEIQGHGQRFAFWTLEARSLLEGTLQPVFRVPRQSARMDISQEKLPEGIIRRILRFVVLEDGDPAICTLALTCKNLNYIVSQGSFQKEAHFNWLDSVVNWNVFTEGHKQEFRKAYQISRYLPVNA